jgi:hypothetical protein
MTLTVSDLLAYASLQARIERIDYFDPRYPRPDEVSAWRQDRSYRDRDRRRVFRSVCGRIRSGIEPLVAGSYGAGRRLDITPDAIDYTAGQYAAREIWPAVLDYFEQTNAL